jgi:hypothetical protein
LHAISLALIDHLPLNDTRRALLLQAANAIVEADPPRARTTFFGASSKIRQALQLYAMRPNRPYKRKLDHVMRQILPDFVDSERAIGCL